MERTYIGKIKENLEKEVQLSGFVDTFRNTSAMAFIVLKDITGKVQLTIEKEKHPELLDALNVLTQDSVITVTGVAHASEYVKMGGVEVFPDSITVHSIAEALPITREYIPATKKRPAVERSSVDQRIDYRWIDLRTDKNQLMFKVQTAMTKAFRDFLLERNFMEIHTPKLIAAASESGSDVFEVKYFDRSAYLAQSPQFYKQMAMAAGFERIFETGP
ncbi:MAG: amino acid--tRNA ligase-related protein, partial [Spirochaetales bacterium]